MGNDKIDPDNDTMLGGAASTQNDASDRELEVATATPRSILQPFWPHKAANWFRLAEIQFDLQKITNDRQKYWQTLSSIQPDTYDYISDFLQNPPKDNQYETLKYTLLDRLAPSDEKQLEALLTGQDIGDRRPSDALRHIRALANNNYPDSMIRSLWVRKMPNIIRIALAAQPQETATDSLAKIADRMHEASQQESHFVNAMTRSSRSLARSSSNQHRDQRPPLRSNTVEQRLERIETTLNRLINRNRSRSESRRFSSSTRSNSRNRTNNIQQNGTCWYHTKFGAAARKCNKPCKFGPSASSSRMDIDEQHKQKN